MRRLFSIARRVKALRRELRDLYAIRRNGGLIDAYTMDHTRHLVAEERKDLLRPLNRLERWLVDFISYERVEEPQQTHEPDRSEEIPYHEW